MKNNPVPLKPWLLTLLFIICTIQSMAQFNETIRASRPGQANDVHAVGTGVFQMESGIQYDQNDSFGSIQQITFNNQFRFGIMERLELRVALGLANQKFSLPGIEDQGGGINQLDLGFRVNVLENEGARPALAFQADIGFSNWIAERFRTNHVAPSFILITSNSFSERFSLNTNWALFWDGSGDSGPGGRYVINVSHSITNALGLFIENYGILMDGDFFIYFDGGFSYLLAPDIQLDLYGGGGEQSYFISGGLSIRWPGKRS